MFKKATFREINLPSSDHYMVLTALARNFDSYFSICFLCVYVKITNMILFTEVTPPGTVKNR